MQFKSWQSCAHFAVPCTDLPAIVLLPAKMVTELRVIADYLVKAPGDNHTGEVI